MRYSGIKYSDMINGPGIRVSLFVSGCSHRCPACFNKETWNENYGEIFGEEEEQQIFAYFRKYSFLRGLSLLGGDPTYAKNIEALQVFLRKFRREFPGKDIWLWTGYTWEEILEREDLLSLISLCDVIVEGKFIEEEKDLSLRWRGSRNQRVIAVQKSLEERKICFYEKS